MNINNNRKNKRYILGVDNGGTYIKAAIYTQNGEQVAISKYHNHLVAPQPYYAEYDQDELWRSNCQNIKNLITSAGVNPEDISVVGISGQGSGFYAIDRAGNSIRNAIASSDRRALLIAKEWQTLGIGEQLYDRIYRYPLSGHLSTILAWLRKYEPESYNRIDCLFSMKDYLVYKLTAERVAGYDCLSASGLMNLTTCRFDKDIAAALDIAEMADKFGRLVWSTDICGFITEEAAVQCGCLPGTPVAAGLHDVNAAALALGAADETQPFIITGTHGINGYVSDLPILNRIVKNNELFAYPGKFLIEEGYPSSSATLDWAISVLFGKEHVTEDMYAVTDQMVDSISPMEEIPVFLPFLRGQRDNPAARGAWLNLAPEDTTQTLVRAVYEGVVFSHMLQLEYLFGEKKKPKVYRIAGGATRSKPWMKMFADALGAAVEIVTTDELGAKGVAIASAVAVGIYDDLTSAIDSMQDKVVRIEPDMEKHALYTRKYKCFAQLTSKL